MTMTDYNWAYLVLTGISSLVALLGVVEWRNRAQEKRQDEKIRNQLFPLELRIAAIEQEMTPNHGKSLRDRIVKIETLVESATTTTVHVTPEHDA